MSELRGHDAAVRRPATPPADVEALPRRIADHMGSPDVARVIYGAIIGLALVVALERHPPTAGQTAAAVIATALAVASAEIYSEFVSTEARQRRRIERAELRAMVAEGVAVVLGAGFPAVFFILAAVHVLKLESAFTLAKWTGLGLICVYGFLAARLAGFRLAAAILHAVVIGSVGGALIAVKALLH